MLQESFSRLPVSHVVSFHSSVRRAKKFKNTFRKIDPKFKINTFHVNGKMQSSERHRILKDFQEKDKSLITNSRCLTEGIDVPKIDAILFADPRKSTVDVVQALGRAMRPTAMFYFQ